MESEEPWHGKEVCGHPSSLRPNASSETNDHVQVHVDDPLSTGGHLWDVDELYQTKDHVSNGSTNDPESGQLHPNENEKVKERTETYAGFSFFVDNFGCVKVFIGGSCINNGKTLAQAGIGVWFGEKHPLNLSEPVIGRPTNIGAVVEAATRAIQQAVKAGIPKLKIHSCSKFLCKSAVEWLPRWKLKSWQSAAGGDIKNRHEFEQLDVAIRSLPLVVWRFIPAGAAGRDEANQLAKEGALQYKPVSKDSTATQHKSS